MVMVKLNSEQASEVAAKIYRPRVVRLTWSVELLRRRSGQTTRPPRRYYWAGMARIYSFEDGDVN